MRIKCVGSSTQVLKCCGWFWANEKWRNVIRIRITKLHEGMRTKEHKEIQVKRLCETLCIQLRETL